MRNGFIRTLILAWILLLSCVLVENAFGETMGSEMNFFMASFGRSDAAGIYCYGLEGGQLVLRHFERFDDASYLVLSEDGKTLYAILENREAGGLATFHVGTGGVLSKLSEVRTPGMGFCHLAVSPKENVVYAADYSHGAVVSFDVTEHRAGAWRVVAQHSGQGVDLSRQQAPHVHQCLISPDGRYLCVVDLGVDTLSAYPLDEDFQMTGEAPKVCKVEPAGSGPRHLLFAANGHDVYLVNELTSTMMLLGYKDGEFTQKQTLSALPENTSVQSWAGALHFSPDGKWLLVTNRGYDSIAMFSIGADGMLTWEGVAPVEVSFPRDFNFIGDSEYLLVAGQKSEDAHLYHFDGVAVRLVPSEVVLRGIPAPICITK